VYIHSVQERDGQNFVCDWRMSKFVNICIAQYIYRILLSMAYCVSHIVISRQLVAHETDSFEKSLLQFFFIEVQSALNTHTKKMEYARVYSPRGDVVCV